MPLGGRPPGIMPGGATPGGKPGGRPPGKIPAVVCMGGKPLLLLERFENFAIDVTVDAEDGGSDDADEADDEEE